MSAPHMPQGISQMCQKNMQTRRASMRKEINGSVD
jgi:hypothetical protein